MYGYLLYKIGKNWKNAPKHNYVSNEKNVK